MVRVTSEIGRLRRVLVHEPGPEVDVMVPSMMEQLLFDDILFGESAREEHRRFRQVLQLMDVDVLDMTELLAQTLQQPEARSWILDILERESSIHSSLSTLTSFNLEEEKHTKISHPTHCWLGSR